MSQTQQPPGAAVDPKTPLRNPLLQQIETEIESVLPPDQRDPYMRLLVAGMHAALDPQPNGQPPLVAQFRQSKDPINDAAIGSAGIMMMLYHKANGAALPQALIPAGMSLLLKALDFLQRTRMVPQIAEPDVDRATHAYTDQIFKAFHITPQGIQRDTKGACRHSGPRRATQDIDPFRRHPRHDGDETAAARPADRHAAERSPRDDEPLRWRASSMAPTKRRRPGPTMSTTRTGSGSGSRPRGSRDPTRGPVTAPPRRRPNPALTWAVRRSR
jgi:hypothetical protein